MPSFFVKSYHVGEITKAEVCSHQLIKIDIMTDKRTIGFGGSCHWCTEAIFQSIKGVSDVDQGWISSTSPNDYRSEAVLLNYNPQVIPLEILVEIHLHTHSCTANHQMRSKYRSAIYVIEPEQASIAHSVISRMQINFEQPIITKVLAFKTFKRNEENYLNYYLKNPQKPFCQTYISPKLSLLLKTYGEYVQKVDGSEIRAL